MTKLCLHLAFVVGALFIVASLEAEAIQLEFNISVEQRVYGNSSRPVVCVNGQSPGPVIEVNEGDNILVNITNSLKSSTSIHWHGISHYDTPYMDGVPYITQCPILPGGNLVMNFTAEPSGTLWYHGHSGMQRSDGLYGALIIHPKDDVYKNQYSSDQTLIVTDWYYQSAEHALQALYEGTQPREEPFSDTTWELGLINGQMDTTFSVSVNQQQTIRLRLINAGTTWSYKFSIDMHNLTVIAIDGSEVIPQEVDSIILGLAERYDVLVTADQEIDNYWIRFDTQQQQSNNSTGVKAVLRYMGASPDSLPTAMEMSDPMMTMIMNDGMSSDEMSDDMPDDMTSDLNLIADDAMLLLNYHNNKGDNWMWSNSSQEVQLILSGDMMDGFRFYINSTMFTLPTIPLLYSRGEFGLTAGTQIIQWQVGDKIQLIVNNQDMMAHPFHIHGYRSYVLGMGMGTFKEENRSSLVFTAPPLKDTVVVPPLGWAVLGVDLDHPGAFLAHCHNAFHAESGMTVVFYIGKNDIPLPPDNEFFSSCLSSDNAGYSHLSTEASTAWSYVVVSSSSLCLCFFFTFILQYLLF